MKTMLRRDFLQFLGKGIVATTLLPPFITACAPSQQLTVNPFIDFPIKGISPDQTDLLTLADGLNFEVLIRHADRISDVDTFGFNCDYTAFIPESATKGTLWVNHEYPDQLFVSGYKRGEEKTKAQADQEMYALGGSILDVEKVDGKWQVNYGPQNKRLNGHSMIPFNWPEPIAGATEAMGTFQNCSGGVTPWGTILTCEENYQGAYGERFRGETEIDTNGTYGWSKFYPNAPEHYGWVVEVDTKTGEAQKHIALGRFCHECANIIELEDGRVVVYSGDDGNDQHLYKFISSKPGSLREGILYAADTESGEWLSLDFATSPALQAVFKDQTEVLINCREAARMIGATPLDRPEDIDVDPVTGHVLVACSNNKPNGNYHGAIMKVIEDNGQYDSLTFQFEVLHAGGEETGFSCPDNMAFDRSGNLWFTSDISGSKIGKAPYQAFGNNGLFLVPRTGDQAGAIIQMASAPKDAELTGPFFSPDGSTLFLSVQHPGERTQSLDQLTSNWPNGGDAIPQPSVVAIQGDLLKKLHGLV